MMAAPLKRSQQYHAGELRYRITLLRRRETTNDRGGQTYVFDPVFETRAAKRTFAGSEAFYAMQIDPRSRVLFITRFTRSIEWRAEDQVREERTGKVWEILSAVDPDGREEWLEVVCTGAQQ